MSTDNKALYWVYSDTQNIDIIDVCHSHTGGPGLNQAKYGYYGTLGLLWNTMVTKIAEQCISLIAQ